MSDDLVKRPVLRIYTEATSDKGGIWAFQPYACVHTVFVEESNYRDLEDRAEAAEAGNARLRQRIQNQTDQINGLERSRRRLESLMAGADRRVAVAEADNARLRAELTNAADSLDWADAHLEDAGVVSANVRYGARDALALIDNPGKEVMPSEARSNRAAHDIGPGDQAVAGAAPVTVQEAARVLLKWEAQQGAVHDACSGVVKVYRFNRVLESLAALAQKGDSHE
jgi:hypothetical protein